MPKSTAWLFTRRIVLPIFRQDCEHRVKEIIVTPFEYLRKTEKKRLDDLFRFLSFPSVSAKSENRKDMIACAKWLKAHLAAIGFKTANGI